MLKTWTPRGPQDPHKWGVCVLALRHAEQRDALVVNLMLTGNELLPKQYAIEPNYTRAEILMQDMMTIKLPGAYGLIICKPNSDDITSLRHRHIRHLRRDFDLAIISKARDYHTQLGWDYAWFVDVDDGNNNAQRAAGRSPTEMGRAMRTNLRLIMASLKDRTFKEKGVTYGNFYMDNTRTR